MSDFLETVELTDDDLILKINKSGSPFKFKEEREVEVGQVVSAPILILKRPVTDDERAGLKTRVVQMGEDIEAGLVIDLEILQGYKALKELPGKEWAFYLGMTLSLADEGSSVSLTRREKKLVSVGDTVAGMVLLTSRQLTDAERAGLRVQAMRLGDAVEQGLIADLVVPRGFVAEPGSGTSKIEGHLRVDRQPQDPPE